MTHSPKYKLSIILSMTRPFFQNPLLAQFRRSAVLVREEEWVSAEGHQHTDCILADGHTYENHISVPLSWYAYSFSRSKGAQAFKALIEKSSDEPQARLMKSNYKVKSTSSFHTITNWQWHCLVFQHMWHSLQSRKYLVHPWWKLFTQSSRKSRVCIRSRQVSIPRIFSLRNGIHELIEINHTRSHLKTGKISLRSRWAPIRTFWSQ